MVMDRDMTSFSIKCDGICTHDICLADTEALDKVLLKVASESWVFSTTKPSLISRILLSLIHLYVRMYVHTYMEIVYIIIISLYRSWETKCECMCK